LEKCDQKFEGRIYSASSHCVYIEQTQGITKQASEKKNDRVLQSVSFDYIFPNIETDNLPQFRTLNNYLKKEDLERILSQSVYSSRDTHNALSDASKIIDQLLSKLRRNEPDDSEELLERVRAFKSETETFETKRRKVEYELPFSKWLYDYVSAKLPKCYIVTTQRENFIHEDCPPHNVSPCQTNEFASLKADLVIYKDKLRNGDEINCVLTEIKIADDSAYTVSDCFRNMSGWQHL